MRYIILLGTIALITGCASAGGSSSSERIAEILADRRVGEPVDKVCFARTIDGFRENTRDSVVLTRGANSDYLVTVKGCPRLDDAQSIGLTSSTSCLRRSDRLIVSDSAFSLSGQTPLGPDTCWVDAIYEWNEDAIDDAEQAGEQDEVKNK